MSEGLGNIVYNSPAGISGVPGSLGGADNGTSLAVGNIVELGQPLAAAGDPGKLLHNTEIPFNGFSLAFKDVGSPKGSVPIVKNSLAILPGSPSLLFEDGNNNELARLNFQHENVTIGNSVVDTAIAACVKNVVIGSIAGGTFVDVDRSVFIGQAAGFGIQHGTGNVVIGQDTLDNLATTANGMVVIGAHIMPNNDGSLLDGSVLIGPDMFGLVASGFDVIIGGDIFTTVGASVVSNQNVIMGVKSCEVTLSVGTNNAFVGYGIDIASTAVGGGNVVLGANASVGNNNNVTIIGQGISSPISNIAILGRLDQNVIVGITSGATDNGAKLQIHGDIITDGSAPLTAGAGKMKFGKVVTAASALNATKYLEVTVDGVLVKICIN